MSCNILIPNVLLCKLREKQATSQTMLRAESPHLQVVSCNLIVITEHLVKVEEGQGYKQVARQDANESPGEKANTVSQQQVV